MKDLLTSIFSRAIKSFFMQYMPNKRGFRPIIKYYVDFVSNKQRNAELKPK